MPFILNQVNKHGVTTIGLYGYSHGGGTVYEVSQLLASAQNNPMNKPFTLAWTAYIDAVDVRSGPDFRPELHLPVGTNYHYNIYQSKDGFVPDPNGYRIEGADVNIDTDTGFGTTIWFNGTNHVDSPRHIGIFESPMTQLFLFNSLKQRVPVA